MSPRAWNPILEISFHPIRRQKGVVNHGLRRNQYAHGRSDKISVTEAADSLAPVRVVALLAFKSDPASGRSINRAYKPITEAPRQSVCFGDGYTTDGR